MQNAALDAAAIREPSDVLTRAVMDAARNANKTGIRVKAVRVMGDWLPKRADLRNELEQLEKSGDPVQVRQAAEKALGR